MVRDLTTGNPLRRILEFCLPVFIGNLFQQVYNMADSIIVGNYLGVEAFAAVGSTGALNFLVLGFALGLCSGLCIPLAQAFGAGDIKALRQAEAHGLYIAGAVSLVIGVVMWISTRPILQLLQTPENILEDASLYLSIVFAGSFSIILYNLLAGFMRALGDSRTPLLYLVVACITNILLDLLFIAVLHMGVEGAALATVIAQLLSGLLCLRAIRRHFPILHFTRKDARLSWPLVGRLTGIGLPMGLQFSITALGTIVLQTSVNGLGSGAVAAMSAGSKVMGVLGIPLEAAGISMATFTSQNWGAKRLDRVRTGIWQMTLVSAAYCLVALVIARLWGSNLAEIFLDRNQRDIHILIQQYLGINSLYLIPLMLVFVYRNALQGLGYTNAAMGAGLLEMVGRIAIVAFLVPVFGFAAACYAGPVAWILADLLLVPVFIVALRRRMREET